MCPATKKRMHKNTSWEIKLAKNRGKKAEVEVKSGSGSQYPREKSLVIKKHKQATSNCQTGFMSIVTRATENIIANREVWWKTTLILVLVAFWLPAHLFIFIFDIHNVRLAIIFYTIIWIYDELNLTTHIINLDLVTDPSWHRSRDGRHPSLLCNQLISLWTRIKFFGHWSLLT